MGDTCQVDFYLLGNASKDPGKLVCKLALMAWERGHRVSILTENTQAAEDLDDLMWEYPDERFLAHERTDDAESSRAPVRILVGQPTGDLDVVINLTQQAVTRADRFRRLLEIVPFNSSDRENSRTKFKAYRAQGINPDTHEMN